MSREPWRESRSKVDLDEVGWAKKNIGIWNGR